MSKAPHPGKMLAAKMKEAGVTQYRLATDIGIPMNRVGFILAGTRSITAETAIRLAHWFQNDPMEWLSAQARHDLSVALSSKMLARDLSERPTKANSRRRGHKLGPRS